MLPRWLLRNEGRHYHGVNGSSVACISATCTQTLWTSTLGPLSRPHASLVPSVVLCSTTPMAPLLSRRWARWSTFTTGIPVRFFSHYVFFNGHLEWFYRLRQVFVYKRRDRWTPRHWIKPLWVSGTIVKRLIGRYSTINDCHELCACGWGCVAAVLSLSTSLDTRSSFLPGARETLALRRAGILLPWCLSEEMEGRLGN